MIVEQIFCHNHLRNFNYIIACEASRQAVVIDPLRVDLILEIAKTKNYKIKYIINTHEHHDHTEGNLELASQTGAIIYCHYNALDRIPGATIGLKKADVLEIGESIKLEVLDTPGHTMAHVCLLGYNDSQSAPNNQLAIFSGDTLFNAGAGRCFSGSVEELYKSFTDILARLPDQTLVYPGHDYLQNNLNFTLSVEPDNDFAQKLMGECLSLNNNHDKNFIVTDMSIERRINSFFRLDNKTIINNLSKKLTRFFPDEKSVFIALRGLRNNW